MHLCYLDESGTPQLPGNTSHYVLAGISIPIWHWKTCDRDITKIKNNYSLGGAEIHTAWVLRKYIEQDKIEGFKDLPLPQRRSTVESLRKAELLRLQRSKNRKHYHRTKKNYRITSPYIHLTYRERKISFERLQFVFQTGDLRDYLLSVLIKYTLIPKEPLSRWTSRHLSRLYHVLSIIYKLLGQAPLPNHLDY